MQELSETRSHPSVTVTGFSSEGATFIQIKIEREISFEGLEHLVPMIRGSVRLLADMPIVRNPS